MEGTVWPGRTAVGAAVTARSEERGLRGGGVRAESAHQRGAPGAVAAGLRAVALANRRGSKRDFPLYSRRYARRGGGGTEERPCKRRKFARRTAFSTSSAT